MKNCKYCKKELVRKVWYGKRRRVETNKRWNERRYCDNFCRSQALRNAPREKNWFFGKHLIPWNKDKSHYGKGWKQSDGKGYIRVYKANNDWEYEHRIVTKEMGLPLGKDDIVHHLNWNKSDNRPQNLLVCLRSEHKKWHREGMQREI